MPFLKMLRGPEPGLEIELLKETITIGRGRKNDVIIQDNEVSREHSRMVRVLDDYEIHDLNSTNGTFVNGQRIDGSGWLLNSGAIVEMGDSITFEYVASELATSPPDLESNDQNSLTPSYLIVQQASRPKPELYRLDRVSLSIGRDMNNDIILNEPEVSRHHLRLLLTEHGYTIEDLNTMNGTFINDEPLASQRLLMTTDTIRIGKSLQMWFTTDPDKLLKQLKSGETVELNEDVQTFATRQFQLPLRKKTQRLPGLGEDNAPPEREQPLNDHVFLVHAHDEWNGIGGELYEYLDKNGVKVWSDAHLERDSEAWEAAVERAQSESRCLLAIISPPSLRSAHVQKIIRFFLAREKPVLLMQYGNVKRLPMMIHNMPAVVYDENQPMRAFRTLLAELQKLN